MRVCVAGLGGLGSAVVHRLVECSELAISELGLVDMDRVEWCNLAHQSYGEDEVGMWKTEAMRRKLQRDGFSGEIRTYCQDVNLASQTVGRLAEYDVYIAALDTFQARVNFYYYIVMECTNSQRLYIDCGTERFKAHCFFTQRPSPCIYCLNWLFPPEKRLKNLCSVRSSVPPPEQMTSERVTGTIMTLLAKESNSLGQAHRTVPSDQKIAEVLYHKVAERYNSTYAEQPVDQLTAKQVEEISTMIQPNTPPVNSICASLVILVLLDKLKAKPVQPLTNPNLNTNFILYIGDTSPVLHYHALAADPNCLICAG
ncbi:hypothetical protein NEHOM01_1939 [Nematocida homosporus]|uniref:uncharacterized protein n=1 Tax=Nematocida homosporus TaxID=1912981 RepID=UPI00222071F6|nr:uncharacterized protein NEHOM01_1939 [Nematocida homosporus]KAI5187108.1 hypothetical protein NEHOM01_1939 [Nematocida homosporus]